LHMTAEMGIVALPLMIWMIITVIVRGMHASGIAFYHKDRRPRQSSQRKMFFQREGILLGSAIGILSLALHGLVDFNFHIPANMNVVAVLAGIIMRND
ncbi:MAG: hypothetical protein KKH94_04905, partial [Candidatus Omnitrophica bacterium]|nr:hypothetical protein [Candidatus Omnitrophota bacterium]